MRVRERVVKDEEFKKPDRNISRRRESPANTHINRAQRGKSAKRREGQEG